MRYFRIVAILITVFFLVSCASSKRGYKADSFQTPLPVAVLPVDNMSNDLTSAQMFRELFKNSLQDLGYPVAKNDDVDFLLQQNGLTDGGQLRNVLPENLCRMLGVDAVFIGTLEKANQLTTGIYNKKQVKASMKLFRRSRPALVGHGRSKQQGSRTQRQSHRRRLCEKGRGQGPGKIQRASATYVDGRDGFGSGEKTSRQADRADRMGATMKRHTFFLLAAAVPGFLCLFRRFRDFFCGNRTL